MPQDDVCSGRAGRGAQTRSVSRRRIQVFEMVNAMEGLLLGCRHCVALSTVDRRNWRAARVGPACARSVRGDPGRLFEVVAAQAREAATMW